MSKAGLFVSVALFACSTSGGPPEEEVDGDGKRDYASGDRPIGTFVAHDDGSGAVPELLRLTLMTDGTYYREVAWEVCEEGAAGGCGGEYGAFKFTHSTNSNRRYVRLTTWLTGELLARYEHVYDPAGTPPLSLRNTLYSEPEVWFSMVPAEEAWCADAIQCGYQNLPELGCAGEFECQEHACVFVCADAPGSSCGGWAGTPCAEGKYCYYTLEQRCGQGDVPGVCIRQGLEPGPLTACPPDYAPVCGCDGTTYWNVCEASAAGTSIAAEISCEDLYSP